MSAAAEPVTRRRRGGLSIQSKLLVMLLGVSLVSSAIVGAIGYISGRESLRAAAFDRLTAIRELRADEITWYLMEAQRAAALHSGNLSAGQAVVAFSDGWEQLQAQAADPAIVAGVEDYYRDTFVPQYEERTQREQSDTALIPASTAARYLQYYYTAPFDDYDEAILVDDAGDGSAWSAAHAVYHDYFRRLVEAAGYEDVLVLNRTGDVVYSAYKGTDLGISVDTGPHRDSALGEAYRAAMATNDVAAVEMRDFEPWPASLGEPALWVVSPIGDENGLTGALAAQIGLDRINGVMT